MDSMVTPELRCDLLWKRLDLDAGLEFARVRSTRAGLRIQGSLVALENGAPWMCRYDVTTDRNWTFQRLAADVCAPEQDVSLRLEHEEDRWVLNGQERPDLRGCTEVDLGGSVTTNTLPVRRLDLQPGHSADLLVAWVGMPTVSVQAVRQRYQCVEKTATSGLYRYQSVGSGSAYMITTDEHGLVIAYEGIAERLGGR